MIFISSFLYSNEALHLNSYWLKLLHYRDGRSEIDDNSFFLAPNGKTSPKAELLATLKGVRGDRYDEVNSTQCRFPARTRWLKSKFPNIRECKYLSQHLKELDFNSLDIIFVSSYLNSPASSFGHTFLRFNRGEDTLLLSTVLNYSAEIDNSIDILSYAYNGIFGGFKGKYGVYPYYKMVKIYSNLDSRDIWEYRLKLSREELERIVLHMVEMQRYHSTYYFISRNCSYNILWFIDLAREEFHFVDEFDYITVPMDTIKLLKRYNLIDEGKFRPSQQSKMEWLFSKIKYPNRAKSFLKDENLSQIEGLEQMEQAKILDLAILKNKSKIETLKYRSKIHTPKLDFNISKIDPINSNPASKLSISNSTFGGRVSYHDIYDIDYDFNEGKYISFFEFEFKKDGLKRLDFLKIESIPQSTPLLSPLSWGLNLGYNENGLKIEGNIGKSYKLYDTLLFFKPSIWLNGGFKIGYRAGALKTINGLKIGVISEDGVEFKPFLTHQMEDNLALHLFYFRKKAIISLFYYF